MPLPPEHLQDLIKQLKSTQSALKGLSKKTELDKIIELIRVKKGWTTPAEFEFALNTAVSLNKRINQLSEELASFRSAASKVREG